MKSKTKILARVMTVFCLIFLMISCDKKPKDGSGNKYDVVKIGDQCWLKQNLRTTKYNDGTPIHAFIENNSDCHINKTGWYADQGPVHSKDSILYGRFYNWYAVNSGKLAPKGWHVATRADWDKLDNFLGKDGKGINANKLRTTQGWRDNLKIGDGLDTYGFSAVPTGYKNFGSNYFEDVEGQTQCIIFWTSTWDSKHICPDDGKSYPYSTLVSMGNSMLLKDQPWCEGFGCSVRCVKD